MIRFVLFLLFVLMITVSAPSYAGRQDAAKKIRAANIEIVRLIRAGQYAKGLQRALKTLELAKNQLGAEHPSTLNTMNNLAFLYKEQGRFKEAEPLFKQCLVVAEKIYGLDHPEVAGILNNLALLYRDEGRYAEAEPMMMRALKIRERTRGPWHLEVAMSLNSLAQLYGDLKRYEKQEEFLKRSLKIRERVLPPGHPALATALDNLASSYQNRGAFTEAEPLVKRALSIYQAAYGPNHPHVAITLRNLVSLYERQGKLADAKRLLKKSLEIREKTIGSNHPDVASASHSLAQFYFRQQNWSQAAKAWRRSTAITADRTLRDAREGSRPMARGGKRAATRLRNYFTNLVKAAYRSAPPGSRTSETVAREMFEIAQWAQNSRAAQALSQMAARAAAGSPNLAEVIRERQRLVETWRKLDAAQSAAFSQPPKKRNQRMEARISKRLDAINRRIASISKRIATEFPEYGAFSSPAPVSVKTVQSLLGPDEALIFILDTGKLSKTPEEIFIWAVTKNKVRWARSEFKGPHIVGKIKRVRVVGQGPQVEIIGDLIRSPNLTGGVKALRCGLDAALWKKKGPDTCSKLLKTELTAGDPLPFDLARSHELYKALFGEVEADIKGKHLLIVPSGPLAQLPFQVLVKSLPKNVQAGEYTVQMPFLGLRLKKLSATRKERLKWRGDGGVWIKGKILKRLRWNADGSHWFEKAPKSPALAAGVKANDILVKIDDEAIKTVKQAHKIIQSRQPGSSVRLSIWRNGQVLSIDVTLGAKPVINWRPVYWNKDNARSIRWLARENALSVLPAVSSLKALRRVARLSAASKPMIGFGNPLLDGPQNDPQYGAYYQKRAKQARDNQQCHTSFQRVAALFGLRGVTPIETSGRLADIATIRMQTPLPETADELCAVARDLKVDVKELRLGARATEHEVKRLNQSSQLAQYRIVHFATHGALAGELKGSSEPGLLLTPPDTASENDDGYLSASEIAGLKLDADWVILSACNTAAGSAEGAEALSGLARAFIYAQARALLVSHWAVDSNSTVKLITGAMREMAQDSKVGRAEALRRSMLALIDKGKGRETHPANWAPFIVVGEGAR
jgi:CHAT domain-containing protein/tetratricopeptide (TPR) repeat protein